MKSSRPLQKAPFGFRVSLSAPISSAQSPSHSQRPAAPTAFDKGDAAGAGRLMGNMVILSATCCTYYYGTRNKTHV